MRSINTKTSIVSYLANGADGANEVNYHATHVTGTILAAGINPSVKGMAPKARGINYDWTNDRSEALSATLDGMLISNHSYGTDIDYLSSSPWRIGAYTDKSRIWDRIMYYAPYYLMVKSAGNDGVKFDLNPYPLGGNPRYNQLLDQATAKNGLVVANIDNFEFNSDGTLLNCTIHYSSSNGPTDDLRIKPDISAVGTNVNSTFISSDTSVASLSGTSMAAPSVTGTLLLIQEHYENLNGHFMRAATLKGLALHTATDIGAEGPDVTSGWGALDANKAAQTITDKVDRKAIIDELELNQGEFIEIEIETNCDADELLASISWTDLPGTSDLGIVNNPEKKLVNDLDIKVLKDTGSHMILNSPWKLTSPTTNTKGDNSSDPYERVDIKEPSGKYIIRISHKGTLQTGSQRFSLIVTGAHKLGEGNIPTLGVSFINTIGTISKPSIYGFEDVFKHCKGERILIDCSETKCETQYEFEIAEFDLNTFSVVGTPLYQSDVCSFCEVPDRINLLDYLPSSSFSVGKIYRFKLAVGSPWRETISFFNVNHCIPDLIDEGNLPLRTSSFVYPNPASNNLFVSNQMLKKGSVVEIKDLFSESVLISKKVINSKDNLHIDVSGLTKGIYILNIQNDKQGNSNSIKFIKE